MAADDYNFFICYRGEKGGVLAANICNEVLLQSKKTIFPFFAPRCVKKGDNFFDACINAAANVPLMLIVLSEGFFDGCRNADDVVYQEIKAAMRNEETEFLPIIMQGFNFKNEELSDLFDESEIDRIKHVSALEFHDVYSFSAYEMLLPILRNKIGVFDVSELLDSKLKKSIVGRKHIADEAKQGYFSAENVSEVKRLNAQQQLLFDYDMQVYQKYLCGKSDLAVLDIGCSDGRALMSRLGGRDEVGKLIGIEYDENSVKKANENYANSKAKFYQCDLESDDFEDRIEAIMEENQIEKFDWINVLAVVSHLKSPFKVFKTLKKLCKSGAIFFVRNIDDGLNLAYPDPKNEMKRAFDLLSKCETVGYRYSGRELYSLFVNLNFADIELEKFGLSNVGMDYDSKMAFFDVIFKFIKNGIYKAVENHSTDYLLKGEKAWFDDHMDELEERFLAKETFINFGFIIFVAIV